MGVYLEWEVHGGRRHGMTQRALIEAARCSANGHTRIVAWGENVCAQCYIEGLIDIIEDQQDALDDDG